MPQAMPSWFPPKGNGRRMSDRLVGKTGMAHRQRQYLQVRRCPIAPAHPQRRELLCRRVLFPFLALFSFPALTSSVLTPSNRRAHRSGARWMASSSRRRCVRDARTCRTICPLSAINTFAERRENRPPDRNWRRSPAVPERGHQNRQRMPEGQTVRVYFDPGRQTNPHSMSRPA